MDGELEDSLIERRYEHTTREPRIRHLPRRSLRVILQIHDSAPAQELLLAILAPVQRCTNSLVVPTRGLLASMVPESYRRMRRQAVEEIIVSSS